VRRRLCDLEAATAICELADDMTALDAIERLLDASLVTRFGRHMGRAAIQLLETVRGIRTGAARGFRQSWRAARQAHAEHYGAWRSLRRSRSGHEPDGPAWMERLATERDNIRPR
jgi:hypothetical protein